MSSGPWLSLLSQGGQWGPRNTQDRPLPHQFPTCWVHLGTASRSEQHAVPWDPLSGSWLCLPPWRVLLASGISSQHQKEKKKKNRLLKNNVGTQSTRARAKWYYQSPGMPLQQTLNIMTQMKHEKIALSPILSRWWRTLKSSTPHWLSHQMLPVGKLNRFQNSAEMTYLYWSICLFTSLCDII